MNLQEICSKHHFQIGKILGFSKQLSVENNVTFLKTLLIHRRPPPPTKISKWPFYTPPPHPPLYQSYVVSLNNLCELKNPYGTNFSVRHWVINDRNKTRAWTLLRCHKSSQDFSGMVTIFFYLKRC